MGFNIGPRVVRATGGGIERVGNHRIHHFPPAHVTDGLVLHLDAADRNSLDPQQGITAWNNLAPGGNYATTIYNGGSYDHTYGGTVYMNPGSSTNDYANIIADGKLQEGSFTIDLWLRWTDINSGAYTNIWSTDGYNNGTTGFALYTFGAETRVWGHPRPDAGNTMMIQTTGTWANDTWYNMVLTRDIGTKKLKLYKNGIGIGTASNITTNWETHNVAGDYSLGTRDGSSYPFDGHFSIVKGYKRALSEAEIIQNYEADKLRHQATYSTTFSPTCAGSGGKVDVLCVAGGGGGGTQHGGGGGAGGYLENTGLTIISGGTYTAAVGAGGTGAANGSSFSNPKGGNGGNSVFSGTSITTMTSVGGGGGGSIATSGNQGNSGGSGGGAGLEGNGAGQDTSTGGAGTAGQGFAGGKHGGYSGTNYGGGAGGGGAGGVGQNGVNGSTYISGAGGPGKTSSISGTPVTYAGGGGGGSHQPFIYGAGGSGGGGRGGLGNATTTANGHNGENGKGGGGGGAGAYTNDGGCGGYGTIIIRYPAEDYNVEMLIVGGGGGGGKSGGSGSDPAGGGGGGGGLLYYSSYKITSGKTYITYVGAGGEGRGSASLPGDNGYASVFGNITAFGGGGGGYANGAGSGGGSGGGGGGNSGGKGLASSGGQGNDGGASASNGGGGGGGAGAAGTDAGTSGTGHGGAGLAYSINGTSTTYAGGGGGGARLGNTVGNGGAGGGGNGQIGSAGVAGTDGLGGGGGGTSTGSAGGIGGQGIIIIAYKGPQRGEGGTVSTTARAGYTVHTFTVAGPDTFVG